MAAAATVVQKTGLWWRAAKGWLGGCAEVCLDEVLLFVSKGVCVCVFRGWVTVTSGSLGLQCSHQHMPRCCGKHALSVLHIQPGSSLPLCCNRRRYAAMANETCLCWFGLLTHLRAVSCPRGLLPCCLATGTDPRAVIWFSGLLWVLGRVCLPPVEADPSSKPC